MSKGITRQQVFEAANLIAAKGLGPTQDSVRAFLGSGSRATLHKYLKEWKQACFQKSSINMLDGAGEDVQELLKEKHELEQIIDKQTKKNEHLSFLLVEAELENARSREKVQRLEAELKLLKNML